MDELNQKVKSIASSFKLRYHTIPYGKSQYRANNKSVNVKAQEDGMLLCDIFIITITQVFSGFCSYW